MKNETEVVAEEFELSSVYAEPPPAFDSKDESKVVVDTDINEITAFQSHESGESDISKTEEKPTGLYGKIFGQKENKTVNGLSSRHVTFIALGGTIGTGVFLSLGQSITIVGPMGCFTCFIIVGIFVYSVVICLGEMASYIPSSGAFAHYGSRFVDDSFGFALGINYYLQWAFSIPSELTAAAIIIQFWAPHIGSWVWAIVIIVPMFFLQLISVKTYGETEYWLAIIKVFFVVAFIIIGLFYDWGAMNGLKNAVPSPGLSNLKNGQAWVGGFSGFFQVVVLCFYSYGGTELVALTSGETAKPWKSIPSAVRATVWRIMIFLVMTVFVIGLCINYKDDRLLKAAYDSDVAQSPFTIVFEDAGFGAAKHVVNAILLTAVLSAVNACFFASSRMLMNMAHDKRMFSVFGLVNKRGVPIGALLLTFAISCLVFLTTIWGNAVVFTWFMNITGASAILTWMSIGFVSIRFRQALKVQGIPLTDLPLKQPLYPLLPILILVLGGFLFAGMGYASVKQDPFSWKNPFGTYLGVAVFAICYFGWKGWNYKTDKFVRSADADLISGRVWSPGQGPDYMAADKEAIEARIRANKDVNIWGKIAYYNFIAGRAVGAVYERVTTLPKLPKWSKKEE
ncbi:YALIA101S01e03686g1_1 [Yarrowia lipolytica]|nr:Lysine permease LysP [Yarrowia lipolytica]SEI30625.1 YALIA101S01e03686g1_1 [Yarrowia lipolytica]